MKKIIYLSVISFLVCLNSIGQQGCFNLELYQNGNFGTGPNIGLIAPSVSGLQNSCNCGGSSFCVGISMATERIY
jgi:hypothetical protein